MRGLFLSRPHDLPRRVERWQVFSNHPLRCWLLKTCVARSLPRTFGNGRACRGPMLHHRGVQVKCSYVQGTTALFYDASFVVVVFTSQPRVMPCAMSRRVKGERAAWRKPLSDSAQHRRLTEPSEPPSRKSYLISTHSVTSRHLISLALVARHMHTISPAPPLLRVV